MKKKGFYIVGILMSTILFSACGANYATEDSAAAERSYSTSNSSLVSMMDTAEYDLAGSENEVTTETSVDAGLENADSMGTDYSERKLITTADLTVETVEFDAFTELIQNKVEELGGYVQSVSLNNYSYSEYRYSSMTLRVPSQKMDELLDEVGANSNIVYQYKDVEDVTLTYVDLESHKEVLLTEQETLLRLLEEAENIEDVITLESRLSDVRYQIESMESQLRTYDNLIDYSTIYLSIDEVSREQEVPEETLGSRMKAGVINNFYLLVDSLEDFLINIVIHLPFIIFWFVIVLLVFIVFILLRKKHNKKKILKKLKLQGNKTPDETQDPGKNE